VRKTAFPVCRMTDREGVCTQPWRSKPTTRHSSLARGCDLRQSDVSDLPRIDADTQALFSHRFLGKARFCRLRGHSRTLLAIHGRSEILEEPKSCQNEYPGWCSRGDEDALRDRAFWVRVGAHPGSWAWTPATGDMRSEHPLAQGTHLLYL
jgi:hypothetical protein